MNELIARMEEASFRALPVTAVHAAAGHDLLDIRRDPFDRLLVAQAMTDPLRLLSDLGCPQPLLKLLRSLAVEDKVGAYSWIGLGLAIPFKVLGKSSSK
ncbi:hypothetical protein [Mycetohabitans rhizoxinica]|uniref:hypothetical protein n=1 Tax=Mycetohabitans rhizoxinica TaxID=412963 RepID=UPI0030D485FD